MAGYVVCAIIAKQQAQATNNIIVSACSQQSAHEIELEADGICPNSRRRREFAVSRHEVANSSRGFSKGPDYRAPICTSQLPSPIKKVAGTLMGAGRGVGEVIDEKTAPSDVSQQL